MAAIFNFLFALLFLSLVGQGYGQCNPEQLSLSQTRTGGTVQNKPEWEVTIHNPCLCTQSDIKLGCDGFNPVVPLDPKVLAKSGGECLINDGQPIAPNSDFTFKYGGDSFGFTIVFSQVNCS